MTVKGHEGEGEGEGEGKGESRGQQLYRALFSHITHGATSSPLGVGVTKL